MAHGDAQPHVNQQYPKELDDIEQRLLRQRRLSGVEADGGVANDVEACPGPVPNQVGLALSGGGIRSATLSLGILQAFAAKGYLRYVDYVSAVSGGNYMATCLGALFLRDKVQKGHAAHWDRVENTFKNSESDLVRWLRQNGSYLAPNGAGDLSLAAAVVLRNLLALHFVIATLALSAFMLMHGVRGLVSRACGEYALPLLTQLRTGNFLWSPYCVVPAFMLLTWVLPMGIAYWFVPSDEREGGPASQAGWGGYVLLLSAITAAFGSVLYIGRSSSDSTQLACAAAALILSVCTAVVRVGAGTRDAKSIKWLPGKEVAHSSQARYELTVGLQTALVSTVVVSAIALIDSIGQTVYAIWLQDNNHISQLSKLAVGAFSTVATLSLFGERVAGLLTDKTRGPIKIPLGIVAGLVATAVATLFIVLLSVTSYALAWQWRDVQTVPSELQDFRYGVTFAALVAATLIVGRRHSFINRSTLSSLYSARLARAYIGASNPERAKPDRQSFTTLLDGDEYDLDQYRPHEHGGPLSIINATINETVDGRSQVHQADRKGMGMAIGPAGVSVGVRHHAKWASDTSPGALLPVGADTLEHRVFESPKPTSSGATTQSPAAIKPRWPTLGRWLAISGAAVSTGLGARTSLALSLVIGLFNLRLGHWFRSGIASKKSSLFARVLPVHSHLIGELTARFPGTAQHDWYLTDGGHFENTGAYELLRRQLPFIVLCDNGANPERCFGDLGSLVRKARLDFGARIHFLGEDELPKLGKLNEVVGSLAELGFCGRLGATLRAAGDVEAAKGTGARPATRYAALASIRYDGGKQGYLLVLRPAVLGAEPLDVLHYQVANPAFPQESTSDQFFDESQWEAYRLLGQFMAEHVLDALEQPVGMPAQGWAPIAVDRVTAAVGGSDVRREDHSQRA